MAKVKELREKHQADLKAAPLFEAADKVLKGLRKRRDAAKSTEDRNRAVELMNERMAKTRKRYRELLEQYPQ